MAENRQRAAVVVLGDFGRSPRMQYHTLSLAQQAHSEVDLVANGGSEACLAVRDNPSIHLHLMKSVQLTGLSKVSGALALVVKAALQFIILLWFLCLKIPRPDVFIVQNPPSVPTLAAVKLSSWLKVSKFIVDWHNFGYTLLGLSHGRRHIIVKAYYWMVNDIRQAKDIHDFVTCGNLIHGLDQCGETMFTSQIDDDIILKPNRPALVVSSTSWTQDEDFNILLQAALMYDRRVAASLGEDDSVDEERLWIEIDNKEPQLFPRLLFIITGKGPERRRYEEQIRKLKLRRVAFRTMWLSAEDYPLLLGSADLGVSLHTSSSGLDLPMKVVDMFGCGLPVCAASFSCIEELVKVDENGLLFSSPTELADEFMMLFRGFPEKCQTLQSLKEGALATCSSSKWSSEWETCALPLISEILLGNKKDVERN